MAMLIEFTTQNAYANQTGFLQQELLNGGVDSNLFNIDPETQLINFVLDGEVNQAEIDWAQEIADNFGSLTLNLEDEGGNPITEIPNDGETKLVLTCDELPTEFGYAITGVYYNNPIVDDTVDTDGTVEITSNQIGVYHVRVYDPMTPSRVSWATFKVV